MRELRVAMVGSGFMGQAHSLAYAMVPLMYKVPAKVTRQVVVDVSDALASAAAARFGFAEWSTSWREVLDRDDIDIVSVVTPNDSHEEISVAAAERGKHILCEKPLALDAAGAERMWRAAEKAGVVNMAGFNYPQVPAIAYAKRLLEDGQLGQPSQVRFNYLQDWGLSGAPFVWRFDSKRAGSGAVGDIGSHAIDCAEYLLGDIVRVSGRVATLTPTRPIPGRDGEVGTVDVDDVAMFLAEFDSGVLGAFTASRHSPFRKNQLAFELDASRGALRFTWDKRDELQVGLLADPEPIAGFRAVSLGPSHPDPWWPIAGMGTGYLETSTIQVHKFLDAILTGAPVRPTFRDATHVQRVVDAVLQSHQSGAWVEVEPVSEAVGVR